MGQKREHGILGPGHPRATNPDSHPINKFPLTSLIDITLTLTPIALCPASSRLDTFYLDGPKSLAKTLNEEREYKL